MQAAALSGGGDPVIEPRVLGRIAAFVGASIAVHALLLGAYVPGSGGTGARDAEPATVLRAVIAPAPSVSEPSPVSAAVPEEPATPPDLSTASPAPATEAQSQRGVDIPRPDKWFTGAEVTAVADPLVAPNLVYPRELEGSGFSARVRLRLFVDERGVVRKMELVQPARHGAFDDAALKAWEGVPFRPAQKDGTAVKSQKLLEVEFQPG